MTRIGTLLALALMCAGCANTYRGAAIEGWVVDAETKQPLEDVIVVIMWELDSGGFHPGQAGALFRKESVTDKGGRFSFPAWGPIQPKDAFLRSSTPYIALFKRGYEAKQLRNEGRSDRVPKVWASDWNGKTVELSRYQGTLAAYDKVLYSVDFLYGTGYSECDRQQMPRLTAELSRLRADCIAADVYCSLPDPDVAGTRGCHTY